MKSNIVEKLIAYGKFHLGLTNLDAIYVKNILMKKLSITEEGEISDDEIKLIESYNVPDELVLQLKQYLLSNNLVREDELDIFVVDILGDITPTPSEVHKTFLEKDKFSHEMALRYLYDLEIKNDYIKKSAVSKNIEWNTNFDEGTNLRITINLSKPEKNNKDIAKLVHSIDTNYPKCLLCKENLGYYGRSNHPARKNIRIIPLKLDDEEWFLQFSPYVYYNEHCIVINSKHEPMKINAHNVSKLLSFVDMFPNYFIGSNADLPAVGGSILNHEHFQGGNDILPLMNAKDKYKISVDSFDSLSISYLDWYNSAFLIKGTNKEKILDCFKAVQDAWINYDNESLDIINKTTTLHSTLTPIVRKISGVYYLYLILRNNRANEEYPDGIFHAHSQYHNIKKEGIGLIEAMGLFILPARLSRQMNNVKMLLSDKTIDLEDYFGSSPDMKVHQKMIEHLREKTYKNDDDISLAIKQYIDETCKNILLNTGVFKNTEQGYIGLVEFISRFGGKIC